METLFRILHKAWLLVLGAFNTVLRNLEEIGMRAGLWLLILGVFGLLTMAGGALFLASLLEFGRLVSWPVGFLGILMAIGGIAGGIAYIVSGLRAVPESERWVIEVFGSFSHIAQPGLMILLTGIERVRNKQTTREQFVSVTTKGTLTLDGITVDFLAELYYILNLQDPNATYAATYAFERGDDPELAIKNLAESGLRSIAGTRDLEFLKNHQDEINILVQEVIGKTMISWGFLVDRHVIKELILPVEIRVAMERQLISEQEGSARVIAAEKDKLATILAAEASRQQRILAAEANEQEQVLDARGEAARLVALAEKLGGPEQAMTFHLLEKGTESASNLAPLAAIAAVLVAALRPPQKP